jgi:hypothetical protein
VSYEELERMLYNTLKSKENLNELCEELLLRYNELNEKYLLRG